MNERKIPSSYQDFNPMFHYYEELSQEELFPITPILSNPFGDIYKRVMMMPVLLRKRIRTTVNPKWTLVEFYKKMQFTNDHCDYLIIPPPSDLEQQLIIKETLAILKMFTDYINQIYPLKS